MEMLSYMQQFVEVARMKNFRAAALSLDMPIATLSRHVSNLEKAVGLRLLNRSTRRVELTDAGEVYFLRCQSIVAEALIAHEALRDVAERPTGTLRVSMPVDLAIGHLGPILRDFAVAYPLIDFDLDLTPRRIDMQTEAFDLAIRIGPLPAASANLIARPIASLPRYLYASPDYLKKAPPIKHVKDLAHHEFCTLPSSSQQDDIKVLYRGEESVEVKVPTRFCVNSVGMARVLASLGMGIAVMHTELARDDVAAGRLRRVLPEWRMAPLEVHAVTATRLLPARARLFIDFLKSRITTT
ncbi:DNA-binding transcriptional LysR family regulator [Herbaspirillum sp. Sphag1AN]|uniref:LysR family transcriptional regulator n=1 Tax=unclassified Herbaspirillum TaxID=2624150 RepID=UPI001622719A|nr:MULTISPECIES: LysR family transcriptional regulator [unclassified Herbaspirillum]MBB3213895.1 DNA-binding transcriptional LysR family regulator [Herbaspirillum sp. Sphag1AN]MBB3247092.1 DNA-binding transcriptional LysR family regulator [Herbaspirillum sp. Sphag64]